MSGSPSLFPTLHARIAATVAPGVPRSAVTRLALLVTGILAAKSATLARIAAELHLLALTDAACEEHIERRLRRTLNDPHLTYAACYAPVLPQVLDWPALLRGSRQVVLAVDDSSKTDEIHLLRITLTYWGGSLPLAWAVWPQNVAQPEGDYWVQMDRLFAQVAALLPPGLSVVMVADRAFAVPNFIDRCAQRGWHWVVRVTTTGSHRFRDGREQEGSLHALVARHLRGPGQRWKARGWVFKDAGWRAASVVGMWARGMKEELVVLSDLPAEWAVLGYYERRFWIEPGFRNDKSRGWEWEASQVQGVEHHAHLLLGMAWAAVVALCVGVEEAAQRESREERRRARGAQGRAQEARVSVFTMGVRGVRRWLYGTTQARLPWRLPELDGSSWQQRWHRCQTAWLFGPARGRSI